MLPNKITELFTKEVLSNLLPPQRSDDFFEALYGDPAEGAYDISLLFKNYASDRKILSFEFQLHERPGKCLACNLTYGLPEVFSRHPVINIKGIIEKIESLLNTDAICESWELGRTLTPKDNLHTIPMTIRLK